MTPALLERPRKTDGNAKSCEPRKENRLYLSFLSLLCSSLFLLSFVRPRVLPPPSRYPALGPIDVYFLTKASGNQSFCRYRSGESRMHFVRRSWKISYTGLSRLETPFGRAGLKLNVPRFFSKGSFKHRATPYRISLREKIPLYESRLDRETAKASDGTFASRYIVSLSALLVSPVRLFSVSGHSTSRNCRVERCCVFPGRLHFLQFVCFSPSIFCYVLTAPDPRQFSEKSILYERSLRYEDA